jgi:hypothetical protein
MNLRFRPSVLLPLPLLLTFCTPIQASSVNENLPDAQTLSRLELQAQEAKPREQCFLYTELVHTMTEIAGRQMLNGDVDQASATLKKVEHYAELIHLGLARDTKRLKNAEMLMHHTTYKLSEYLHQASGEDQATLQATLKQLDHVQNELLTQVFNH